MDGLIPSASLDGWAAYLLFAAGLAVGIAVFGTPISSLAHNLDHKDTVGTSGSYGQGV